MAKKIIILVLFLVAVISVFFLGKSLLSNLLPGQVTLTYWGLWEEDDTLRNVFAGFEKAHPNVKIQYSRQTVNEYRERLQSALDKDNGPDIFRFHNTWLPMLKTRMSSLPQSVMEPLTYQQQFYPVAFDNLSSAGKIYGIPLEIDTLALYYNEDLFQQAGVQPPANWDDLRKVANQLTVRDADGHIKISGVALGTADNIDHFSDILGIMFLQNGTDMKKVSSTIGTDGHNLGEDTIKFYTNFTTVDKVWDDTMDRSTVAFAAGKLAMYFGPSWEVFNLNKLNENSPVKVNYKIIPIPQLTVNKNLSWATYWAEGVSAKSKNQSMAWELLKYLSQKENLQAFYKSASFKRAFGEPYSRKDMADLLKSDPLVSSFVGQAPSAATWYLCSDTHDNGLNDGIIKYLGDTVNSINKGGEVMPALKTLEDGINQKLAQFSRP